MRPIDELESTGRLTRVRDPADRRRNQVTLTDSGRALLTRLSAAEQRSRHALLSALSPEDQQLLLGLLRRVLEANDTKAGVADA